MTLSREHHIGQVQLQVSGQVRQSAGSDKIAASKAKGMWMGGPQPLDWIAQRRVVEAFDT